MKLKNKSKISLSILLLTSGLFVACNGVPHKTSSNDSVKSPGVKEIPENHSGGPGDSAKNSKSDSSRVVHGGELKNGTNTGKAK